MFFDVFSLCLKSGNACILKGGSDADCSNRAIISVIHKVLKKFKINPHIVELLPADREATAALLNAVGYVDLIIPEAAAVLFISYARMQGFLSLKQEQVSVTLTSMNLGIQTREQTLFIMQRHVELAYVMHWTAPLYMRRDWPTSL